MLHSVNDIPGFLAVHFMRIVLFFSSFVLPLSLFKTVLVFMSFPRSNYTESCSEVTVRFHIKFVSDFFELPI